jgi:putative ABC transport system permease protein
VIFISALINGMREIWAHKVRSILSMSGIILGVSSLVAMVAIVQGMMKNMRVNFEEAGGIEKVFVVDRQLTQDEADEAETTNSPGRTMRDYYALRESVPLARYISPEIDTGWHGLNSSHGNWWAMVVGATPEFNPVNRYEVVHGRMIGDIDVDTAAHVAVLGHDVARRLFPRGMDPLGESFRMRGINYTVIGVMDEYEFLQGTRNALWHKNRRVLIPVTTATKHFREDDKLTHLNIQVESVHVLPDAIEQINNTLLMTHNQVPDFEVRTQEEQLAQLLRLERSFIYSMGGIGALCLVVGGIGIMNVMLAVINERIREIGVRKAVGARSGDIFIQFLIEAIVISTLGGFLGLAFSFWFVDILRGIIPDGENISVPVMALVAGFSFSVGIGIFSGIYPAIRAARLNPIEALRHD